jgi:hypothetical protein
MGISLKGGMSKEVCHERYYKDDKSQNTEQESRDVEGGAVHGLGRRLGDAEKIDEKRGDVAEDEHRYSIATGSN